MFDQDFSAFRLLGSEEYAIGFQKLNELVTQLYLRRHQHYVDVAGLV